MKNFILIGASGYIAERHFKAIKNTKNNLVAVCDLNDSVGLLDKYFPNCFFANNLSDLKNFIDYFIKKNSIEYFVICTPNFLHYKHIKFGLKNNMNVICEKPTVLNPLQIIKLKKLEKETGKNIYTILQLRLHKELIKFRKYFKKNRSNNNRFKLKYITSRGDWYFKSWKGSIKKSGGIATNIGIHLFDILIWIIGNPTNIEIINNTKSKIIGRLYFRDSIVDWFLSLDKKDLPYKILRKNLNTLRSLKFNNKEIEFSKYFENLHDLSYKKIIKGDGFVLDDTYQSINLCSKIRNLLGNEK
tara:strand:- start:2245 stop:3147 length:903 start_codon:yes stop_codon:yes gene_type:complete